MARAPPRPRARDHGHARPGPAGDLGVLHGRALGPARRRAMTTAKSWCSSVSVLAEAETDVESARCAEPTTVGRARADHLRFRRKRRPTRRYQSWYQFLSGWSPFERSQAVFASVRANRLAIVLLQGFPAVERNGGPRNRTSSCGFGDRRVLGGDLAAVIPRCGSAFRALAFIPSLETRTPDPHWTPNWTPTLG